MVLMSGWIAADSLCQDMQPATRTPACLTASFQGAAILLAPPCQEAADPVFPSSQERAGSRVRHAPLTNLQKPRLTPSPAAPPPSFAFLPSTFTGIFGVASTPSASPAPACPSAAPGRAVIIYGNHPSWWDPALLYPALPPSCSSAAPASARWTPQALGKLWRPRTHGRLRHRASTRPAAPPASCDTSQRVLSKPGQHPLDHRRGRTSPTPRLRPVRLRPGLAHLARRIPGRRYSPARRRIRLLEREPPRSPCPLRRPRSTPAVTAPRRNGPRTSNPSSPAPWTPSRPKAPSVIRRCSAPLVRGGAGDRRHLRCLAPAPAPGPPGGGSTPRTRGPSEPSSNGACPRLSPQRSLSRSCIVEPRRHSSTPAPRHRAPR